MIKYIFVFLALLLLAGCSSNVKTADNTTSADVNALSTDQVDSDIAGLDNLSNELDSSELDNLSNDIDSIAIN